MHQLLLMKRGGQVIYAGPLGRHSNEIIEYFEVFYKSHFKNYFYLEKQKTLKDFALYVGNSWSSKNQGEIQPCNLDARV